MPSVALVRGLVRVEGLRGDDWHVEVVSSLRGAAATICGLELPTELIGEQCEWAREAALRPR